MITLLRRIRQRLLSQNRFSKYLVYAIGEVILVVIGILIALQINNWNENRKNTIKAESYILNIKEDLKKDTISFNKAINNLKLAVASTEFLLNIKEFKDYTFDSLVNKLPIVYYEYDLNIQTFDKLVNSGITNLGGDTELFDDINNYYTTTSNYYYSVRNWDIKETTKDNDLFLNNNFEMPNLNFFSFDRKPFFSVQSKEEKLLAFSNLMLSVEARNRLRNSYHRKNRLRLTFVNTKKAALKLLNKINQRRK